MEKARLVASAMDALSAHIAILDAESRILAVNKAWREFAAANPPTPADAYVGAHYLAVCEAAQGQDAEGAAAFAAGLRAVMAGQQDEFVTEYPCHAPWEARWFSGRVTRFVSGGTPYIIVAHENITSHRQAQAQIQNSEEKFRSLLEHAPHAVIVTDESGAIVLANAYAETLFGYPRVELLGHTVEMLIPASLRAPHVHHRAAYRKRPTRQHRREGLETVGRHKDGHTIPVDVSLNQVRTATETLTVAFVIDITERKRAEEAIRFQAHLLDSIGEAVIATDLQGQITYWNRAAETMFGWRAAEAWGRNVQEVALYRVTPAQTEQILAALREGQSWSGEFRAQRRDGTTFPALVTDAPIHDAAGQLTGTIAVALDISERKHAEVAMLQYTRRLAALHEMDMAILAAKAPAEIARAALDHIQGLLPYQWASVTITDRAGKDFAQLAQAGTSGIFVPPELDSVPPDNPARQTLEQGGVYGVADLEQLDTPSARQKHLQQQGIHSLLCIPLIVRQKTIGALNLGATRPASFSAEHREIAQEIANQLAIAIAQAQLHAEVTESNTALQQAVRVRDAMIQNVSHELRTPLTHIIGYADLLHAGALDGPLNHEQQDAVEIIQQRAYNLSQIINTLLTLQTLTAASLEWSTVNPRRLVAQMVKRWQADALGKGITVAAAPGPAVPSVPGDQERLWQALDHIVENAVKFTPQGGTVTLAVEQRADDVCISVSDTGIGIPQEQLARVFSPFFQVDGSTTRPYGGMGIGLTLVQEIVKLHGGRVWAESDGIAGHGTTVRMALPIHADSER